MSIRDQFPSLFSMLGSKKSSRRAARQGFLSGQSYRRPLHAEQLEDRRLLAVFVVDRTDDTNAGAAQVCSAAANDCSLRGAISKANGAAGADVITFDAATNGTPFTLTLVNGGGANEDANATGDLDVLSSGGGLTITGNGSSNTIIQAGTTNLNGIDKVFAFNPLCDNAAAFSVSDVTVRFGRNTQAFSAPDFSFTGGGIDFCGTGNAGSSFSISNSIVTQNTNTDGYGGGLNIDEVAPAASVITITNTQFTNNTSKYWGGGLNIFGDNVTTTISGSTFSNNQTLGTGGVGAQGGGINIRVTNQNNGDGAPTPVVNISNTTIANNQAVGFGGGIDVQGSGDQDVNISNTSITGNSLIVTAGGVTNTSGGGLDHNNNAARTTTLTNVLIANNTSTGSATTDNGGGVSHGSGTLIIRNSTISENSTNGDGGGVMVTSGPTLTLINSTISNNRADADNTGGGTGGGVRVLAGGTVNLQNTLSDGNKGTSAAVNEINGTVTANFSLIGNTTGATIVGANNQTNVSGRLAALANNGGQTVGPTGFTAVLQTHALLAGSPALDAGSNALVPGALTTDQRGTGFTRILDAADADTTDIVDIGAFEAHPSVEDVADQTVNQPSPLSTSFNVGDIDFTSGINSLTVTSSNTTLVPNANINLGGTFTNSVSNSTNNVQTLVITPAANLIGTTTITITATDTVNGTSQTMTDTFVLTVTAADLTVSKTDTVSNATTLGNTWAWRSTISNGGNGPASFTNGQVIYTDTMPNTNISYGSPSIGASSGITGTINCALSGGNVVTCSASGAVSIAAVGSFRVDVTATPSAIGTFTNPTGGSATADPNNNVSESNEANNDSNSDSVVVTAPDLTVSKTDTVSNTTLLGNTWDWRSAITNGGSAPADFTDMSVIYSDIMPGTNVTYGSPSIGSSTGITGTINCSLSGGNVVTCSASGAVSIAAAGSFRVDVTATPSATGTFINPTGGSATVDPNNNIVESNEANNDSNSDSVVVTCSTTVTTTSDFGFGQGVGSLRLAIICSNITPGTDTIDFNIPGGGVHTIQPASALPTITDAVIIDGTTQPGFAGTPLIELDGSSAGAGTNGLRISAGGSTVRGLVINRFSAAGIRLETGGGNTVAGNYIGTDVSGTADLGNAAEGVIIYSSPSNTIGGTVAADRNVISGNTRFGVEIDYAASTGNLVQGNYIGTDVNGTAALGNTLDGVLIYAAPSNTIGGTAAGAGNVISGNQRHGIYLTAGAANNLVQGNLVGTDINGTADLGNTQNGVLVSGAPSNTIGGTAMGARNVISGNNQNGVSFSGAAATSNLVQGNYIGTDITGTADLGNTLDGVLIYYAPANTIGGTAADAGNVISGNQRHGVYLLGATAMGNLIRGNLVGTDVNGTADLGNAQDGVLVNSAPNNTIGGTAMRAGNVISGNNRFGVEINNAAATNNLVQGNVIGTDLTGTAALGNTFDGVLIYNAPSNTIGGTAAGAGNVISGNQRHGVYLLGAAAMGNLVQGNLVGTDINGTADLGNTQNGVLVSGAPTNTIGGTAMRAGNVISGNNQNGVYLSGTGATGNFVQGNLLGTDINGTADLGNSQDGVLLSSAPNNTIGGTTVTARNVISGNNRFGVELDYAAATGNLVQGNFIGTDVNGTAAVGNTLDGILIYSAPSNIIGGTAAGAGNVISGNQRHGVDLLGTGTGNAILHNSIFSNTGLGIDLNGDGVTANDVDDPDAGPNNRQNFPVITSVLLSGANLDITYSIPSIAPNSTFPLRVEFFIADAANQEGQTFLDSDSYTTTGSKMVTIAAGSAVLGTKIVATATDNGGTGNTSEFSANAAVASSLLAAGGAAPVGIPAASLTSAQLQPIVAAAISRLVVQGLTAAQVNQLSSVQVGIADLPGATLGLATANAITLDANAAGYGWFVDATPGDDAEFSIRSRLSTRDSQLRMDLLTAVMHELGHTLGRDDLHDHGTEDDLMYEALAAGVRRTSFAAADALLAGYGR